MYAWEIPLQWNSTHSLYSTILVRSTFVVCMQKTNKMWSQRRCSVSYFFPSSLHSKRWDDYGCCSVFVLWYWYCFALVCALTLGAQELMVAAYKCVRTCLAFARIVTQHSTMYGCRISIDSSALCIHIHMPTNLYINVTAQVHIVDSYVLSLFFPSMCFFLCSSDNKSKANTRENTDICERPY